MSGLRRLMLPATWIWSHTSCNSLTTRSASACAASSVMRVVALLITNLSSIHQPAGERHPLWLEPLIDAADPDRHPLPLGQRVALAVTPVRQVVDGDGFLEVERRVGAAIQSEHGRAPLSRSFSARSWATSARRSACSSLSC